MQSRTHHVEMNPRKQKTRSRWGGRAWDQLDWRRGLVIPHVNARAVASVQPWGWRGQQHVQHRGAMVITAYKLGPSLEQVNGAGGPLTHLKQAAEIPHDQRHSASFSSPARPMCIPTSRGHAATHDRSPLQRDGARYSAVWRPSSAGCSVRPDRYGRYASATGFMEMAARNGVARRALSLVNGAFSARFADMVARPGESASGSRCRSAARWSLRCCAMRCRRTPVDAVTLVLRRHQPAAPGCEALAAVTREFDDCLVLVD